MKTETFYNSTLNAITNLVNNNFKAVFDTHSSIEIELDLEDDIRDFINYAAENKMPIGVILGEQALKVLSSSEFIREDIDRQFDISDDEDSNLPSCCFGCDGCFCLLNRLDCLKGYNQTQARQRAAEEVEERAWEMQFYDL